MVQTEIIRSKRRCAQKEIQEQQEIQDFTGTAGNKWSSREHNGRNREIQVCGEQNGINGAKGDTGATGSAGNKRSDRKYWLSRNKWISRCNGKYRITRFSWNKWFSWNQWSSRCYRIYGYSWNKWSSREQIGAHRT
jgi:hypothetical protein